MSDDKNRDRNADGADANDPANYDSASQSARGRAEDQFRDPTDPDALFDSVEEHDGVDDDITEDDFAEALKSATTPKNPLAELRAENADLTAQVTELTDNVTRAHAEVQNLVRRHERDQADMAKFAIRKFAKDIVGVADNFQRARESVKPEDVEGNAAMTALLEGFAMTEREFLNVLDKHGVKRIDAAGSQFDPHQHQAMMEQEDPSKPAGTVLQVFQAGFEIAEQVLRPAMVIVSRGGPKPVKAAPAADGGPEASADSGRPTLKMPGQDGDAGTGGAQSPNDPADTATAGENASPNSEQSHGQEPPAPEAPPSKPANENG